MKVYWKDGALNLLPETEEDGQITSSILFAYGEKQEQRQPSNLADIVLAVDSGSTFEQTSK